MHLTKEQAAWVVMSALKLLLLQQLLQVAWQLCVSPVLEPATCLWQGCQELQRGGAVLVSTALVPALEL